MKKENDIKQPEEFAVTNIFSDAEYIVPIYQRNYAWSTDEIEQLLDDINDIDDNNKYYLGSLIVNQNNNVFEVVDGQQRLTTLFLVLSYLRVDVVNKNSLRFEAREKSNRTLEKIIEICGKREVEDEEIYIESDPWFSESILDGLEVVKRYFFNKEKEFVYNFISKLSKVMLVRVQVPKNIDLNHYFEIMNTRGEQLESHEIIKAEIINKIQNKNKAVLAAKIWDACANMEKYVQMNFDKNMREKIFGNDWCDLLLDEELSYGEGLEAFNNEDDCEGEKLRDIINNSKENSEVKDKGDDDENARFESIISFPNFILQVNAAMSHDGTEVENDALLDDKKIISLKEKINNEESALKFVYSLLKYRFLFDKYVIKREYVKDYRKEGKWSLKKLHMYGNGNSKKAGYVATYNNNNNDDYDERNTKQLRQLQSCLRVTYTSPKTMHWIYKVLSILNKDENANLISLLETYSHNKIIDSNYKEVAGFNTSRIIFTYLDYVLCEKKYPEKYSDFQFRFRTSIEHFYPQHPVNKEIWDGEFLNSFGNLALITVSGNSRFSNMLPISKIEYNEIINQSPKLMEMKELIKRENRNWDKNMVKKHYDEMMAIIEKDIEIDNK